MTRPRRKRTAELEVAVNNETGLHLRPARLFVEAAGQFEARIEVACGEQKVNGESIMELLSLAALPDTVLTIRAEGPDADEAVRVLSDLVRRGFVSDE